MLKLHRLDISGFKSFVDPTEMGFAAGITAIVGPNGCGKSNISDAITWVLGEQSAKSLRGASMQDVIFSGTDTRKPVGMADVTLTLVTDPSFEDAVEGKLSIGRRVYRTGESQYRLNGKVTRLKKIKDLLMDTGLGIRAYSVIEQGKIGMILSGKPQERRRLLEEAAGITRYKARKRLAEVKLEEAAANLLRLDDIISEVERALRSLKRQASAARRYKTKEQEYRDLLMHVLLGRWALLRDRMGDLEEELGGLTDRDAELTATLSRQEAALASGREELDEIARVLAERHERQSHLAAKIEGRQEFLKGTRTRLGEVGERLERGYQEAEERRRRSSELGSSLGSLDERTLALVAERDDAARLVAEDDSRIEAAQKAVGQTDARLEALRRELLSVLGDVNRLRSQLQQEQVEIERRTFRRRYLDEQMERNDRQKTEAEATLGSIEEAVEASNQRLDERLAERETHSEDLDAVLRREAELSEQRRRLEAERAGLIERRRLLVAWSEEHAEHRRLLVDKLAALGVAEPRFLADAVAPVEGWEEAIDHFLGDLADAVLVEPHLSGLELARALARHGSTAAFLQPLGDDVPVARVDDGAVRYSLAAALELPEAIGRALPPAYLVDTAEDAARLAAAHPGVSFLSRDRLWAVAGTIHSQGEEAAPGIIARESELETIDRDIPALEKRLRRNGETLDTLVAERTRLAAAINRLDESAAELRREIAVAHARRQDVMGRHKRLLGERQTLTDELAEIARDVGVRPARRGELPSALSAAQLAHPDAAPSFDRTQAEVEDARSRREALRTEGAGRRGRLEVLEERMESQSQEVLRVRHQIEETQRVLQAWDDERNFLEERRVELENAIDRAEEELQAALERRVLAQHEVLEHQDRLDSRRGSLRGLDGEVQENRAVREERRGEIEQLRVSQAGLRQDAEHLSATFREEFKRPLPGSRSRAEAQEADPAAEKAAVAVEEELEELVVPEMSRARLAELEADLARCKAILERLGPVNVLAAEEYEEQLERETFLKAQRRDVADSVLSLKETIREINETSSERFRETFTQVNQNFGEVFTKLFRGGEAQMRLLDEDDMLESGIEIMARPPGKRTQNIMLLSGGEKALTAIALLFALFQSKPSPFCILDEVDAPLDDVNVLRFVDVLQEMAKETQFLVITHNKLTMEVAGTLYGVTMEERGVSKLVSVEMDDVQAAEPLEMEREVAA